MSDVDTRPLRQVFPTSNGKRIKPCPWCGRSTAYSEHDGGYVCINQPGHKGQMFPDAKLVVFP